MLLITVIALATETMDRQLKPPGPRRAATGHLHDLGLQLADWQRPEVCGLNCLFVFLRLHDVAVDHGELLRLPMEPGGVTLADLCEISDRYNFATQVVFATPRELERLTLPAIAQVGSKHGDDHFVVLISLTRGTVRLLDGSSGTIQVMPLRDFELKWSGYLLVPGSSGWTSIHYVRLLLFTLLVFLSLREIRQLLRLNQ